MWEGFIFTLEDTERRHGDMNRVGLNWIRHKDMTEYPPIVGTPDLPKDRNKSPENLEIPPPKTLKYT